MDSTTKRKKINRRVWLSTPYIIWIAAFTIIPVCMVAFYAFTGKNGNFTFENIVETFDGIHLKAFFESLKIAVLCTGLCILLSYPLVMALKTLGMGRKGFTMFILVLPMWMNFVLRVLAWQMILSNNGILNFILTSIGLQPLTIANTSTAVMIGIVYDYLPYMVLPIFNAVMDINEDVIEAAKDLGAGPFTVFFKIIVPLSFPGLLSGIVMVFVPAMTSFAIADILGGGKVQLIGNIIEQEFIKSANWNLGSAVSLILMIFVLLGMAFTSTNEAAVKETTVW